MYRHLARGVIILLLVGTACSGKAADHAGGTTTTGRAARTSTTTTVVKTTTAPTITMSKDGIAGAKFGDSRTGVEAAFTQKFGAPTSTRTGDEDHCTDGTTRIVAYTQSLTAFFRGDRFTGWAYTGHDPSVRTAEGATVGTTIGELRAMYGSRLKVTTTSDGLDRDGDFYIDGPFPKGIHGHATNSTDSGVTTVYQAGDRCGD
jgi:hypothetical protein